MSERQIKDQALDELERRYGPSSELNELRRRYGTPPHLKGAESQPDVQQRIKDTWSIGKDLGVPVKDVIRDYEPLTATLPFYQDYPQYSRGKIPEPSGPKLPPPVVPQGEWIEAAEESKWDKFKKSVFGESRYALPPDADRMAKADKVFRQAVSGPLHMAYKLGNGLLFGLPDMAWAGLKNVMPNDWMDDEAKQMTLEEAINYAAAYNPSGVSQFMGDLAEFSGRLSSAGAIGRKIGVIDPKAEGVLRRANEMAKLFGAGATVDEISKSVSEYVDPTEADYGYEGAGAVIQDMTIGALFSLGASGTRVALRKALGPTLEARALRTLGLGPDATDEEVAGAARRLIEKYRPDRAKGFEAEFKKVVRAKDILKGRMVTAQQVVERTAGAAPETTSTDIVFRGADIRVHAPIQPAGPTPQPKNNLAEMSYRGLQKLAKQAGVPANQKKSILVEALTKAQAEQAPAELQTGEPAPGAEGVTAKGIPTRIFHATTQEFEGLPVIPEGAGKSGAFGEPWGVFYNIDPREAEIATGRSGKVQQRVIDAVVDTDKVLVTDDAGELIYNESREEAWELWKKENPDFADTWSSWEELPPEPGLANAVSRKFADVLRGKGYDAVFRPHSGDVIVLNPEAVKAPMAPAPGAEGVAHRFVTEELGQVNLEPLARAGAQAAEIPGKVLPYLERFRGLEADVRQALTEYEEQMRVIDKLAAQESKDVGLTNLTPGQEQYLADYREQAGKFPERFPEGIPPELQETYDSLVAGIERSAEGLEELGVTANWPNNQIEYLTDRIEQSWTANEPDVLKIEQMEKALEGLKNLQYLHHYYSETPHTGIKSWFGGKKITDTPYGLIGRKFPTLEAAEKDGYVRAPLAVMYAHMRVKLLRAQMADQLITAINENSHLSLWEEEAPSDWVRVSEQIFPKSVSHSSWTNKKGEVLHKTRHRKYPQPVAEALKELTYTYAAGQGPGDILERAYDSVNHAFKIIGFYNPLVMTKNDLVQMWRAAGFVPSIRGLAQGINTFIDNGETYDKLRRAGLFNSTSKYGETAEQITNKMLDEIRLTSGEKTAKWAKKWLNPANYLKNLEEFNEKTTWNLDEIIRIACWHAVKDHPKFKGATDFEVVEWVNEAMVKYSDLPKSTSRWATKIGFTPKYKVGNFKFFWKRIAPHPVKEAGPLLRTVGYKMFIKYGLPSVVAGILLSLGDERDVYTEKGYRVVIHNPETNTDTVIALSDPLLEGAKLTQREFRQTLGLNLATMPSLLLRFMTGPRRKASEDPLGEFFKLGTPFYRELVNFKSKDKNTVSKIMTSLAIGFTYFRKGRQQDKDAAFESIAKALSVWTDWKAQRADLKAMFTGNKFFYGPGGKFGRMLREFEGDKEIETSKIDREINSAIARGNVKEAVRIVAEEDRYNNVKSLANRVLRWRQPLAYAAMTMSNDDKMAFIEWAKERGDLTNEEIETLVTDLMAAVRDEVQR
ncbi:MAG: hypothetical protein GY832_11535 [Chloroflexi bacterium]|nr:hypothetical protein [Chloroflexota bacterium]